MPTPRLTSEQVSQVSGLVSQYITAQRQKYGSRAIPLSAQQRTATSGFFSPQVLDGARLLVLQGERVANPDFYPMMSGSAHRHGSIVLNHPHTFADHWQLRRS
jgi:hypothetical protein